MLKRIVREEDQLTFDMGKFKISLKNVCFADEGIDRMIGVIVANRKYLVTRKTEEDKRLTVHVSFFPTNYYPYLHLRDFLKKADETHPIQVLLPSGVICQCNQLEEVLGKVEDHIYLFKHFLPIKEETNI